ncbi:glycosyltransferase family A protein [Rhodoferax sp.]|uniref:glycosyltransferase family 2 protein n=1 Tax=Rhodoferax sp. TaxID=50421 RepID=UPI0025EFF3FB|nr:glycosyltransferase family A protein [Rhodoferax sp.]
MNISFILATVGRADEVGRCLRSLSAQTDSNFEVLLVDQNNDDRLLPHIQQGLADGLVINHMRMAKPSLSAARNLGIASAKGQIIGLTDDDCWYEPNAVAGIRQAFHADKDIEGIVACWVEQSLFRGQKQAHGLLRNESWRRFRGGDASSISLFFKKSLFDQLGGFDARFGVGQWYGAAEETDFVLRALAAGALLKHCSDVRVHHHFGNQPATPLAIACKHARNRARGTGGIYRKHNLDLQVVLRGLIAPFLNALVKFNLKDAVVGIYVSLGRLEGFIRWKDEGKQ